MIGHIEQYYAQYDPDSRHERFIDAEHRFQDVEQMPYAAPYEHEPDDDIQIADEIRQLMRILVHISNIAWAGVGRALHQRVGGGLLTESSDLLNLLVELRITSNFLLDFLISMNYGGVVAVEDVRYSREGKVSYIAD